MGIIIRVAFLETVAMSTANSNIRVHRMIPNSLTYVPDELEIKHDLSEFDGLHFSNFSDLP